MKKMMTGTLEHVILKKIYSLNLLGIPTNTTTIAREIGLSQDRLKSVLDSLLADGQIKINSKEEYNITEFGRKNLVVVMTGGVFDLLHVGHIFTLQQAKLLGDVLVVVIATDQTVFHFKHKRPTNNQEDRLKLISHLKEVDAAIIGNEEDMFVTVKKIKPDIIALGYDQNFDEKQLYEKLIQLGFENTKIIRLKEYIPGKSTSQIVHEILTRHKKPNR